jgi:hypothetical protein
MWKVFLSFLVAQLGNHQKGWINGQPHKNEIFST